MQHGRPGTAGRLHRLLHFTFRRASENTTNKTPPPTTQHLYIQEARPDHVLDLQRTDHMNVTKTLTPSLTSQTAHRTEKNFKPRERSSQWECSTFVTMNLVPNRNNTGHDKPRTSTAARKRAGTSEPRARSGEPDPPAQPAQPNHAVPPARSTASHLGDSSR